jgi:thiol:disulfide interchange protein DsbD
MSGVTENCADPVYAGFLSLPHGLQGYFDYEQALSCAASTGKPVLVDFVGHTCSNCKKMYAGVWSDPKVLAKLRDDFIIVALYTDDKTRLPDSKWITSEIDGKVKNTIGKLNQDIQISQFGSNALPLYAIVDPEGKSLTKNYYTYNPDVQDFIDWLEEGAGNSSGRTANPFIFY